MEIKRNPDAPHRAIIWMRAQVHEMRQDGHCSGMSESKIDLFPVYIDGCDRDDCTKKLNEFISEVKEKCKSK